MIKNDCAVRLCQPEDLSMVVELLKITDLLWEAADTIETLAKKLEFDPESIMVLVYKDKIIGTATTTYDPWCSFIWHLAIDPELQGQGLGHILAEEAEKRLRDRGTVGIVGYVLPNNKNSLSFLKKRNYEKFHDQVIPVEKIF